MLKSHMLVYIICTVHSVFHHEYIVNKYVWSNMLNG